jgi:lipoyl(octanoyl) transferase
MSITIKDLGITHYKPCWDYQEELFAQNLAAKKNGAPTQNYLLLTEHHPVFTLGKSGDINHLIADEKGLGAAFYRINRGGDITFHGPGQLVVYPIIDLEILKIGLATYIFNLEEIIIRLIKKYGVAGARSAGASGVWLDVHQPFKERKICAIGVKASRYITMHGLAFNVYTDISFFDKIIPCGIQDKGVTSLAIETGTMPTMETIKAEFVDLFQEIFQIAEAK